MLDQTRPKDLVPYNFETSTIPEGELMVMIDHPTFARPMSAPYVETTPAPQVGDLTGEHILELLEIPDIYSATQTDTLLSGKVDAVEGYSLVPDTLIAQLADLKPYVYKILLGASSDVAGRLSGATIPTGITLAASGNDLQITHTFTGRSIAWVSVKELGTPHRIASTFEDAYSGISEIGNTITIEGLDKESVALEINLIFN